MLNLLLAIACSTGNALSMKLAEGKTGNKFMLLLVNYIVTFVFGAFYMAGSGDAHAVVASESSDLWKVVALGLVNGVLYVTTFVLLQRNVAENGATVSASLSHMGILIPIALSVVVFREYPSGVQLVGMLVALVAIVLISVPPSAEGEGSKRLGGSGSKRWLLVPMLVSGGFADMMSKVFAAYGAPVLESLFMQVTFTVALVLCAAVAFKTGERLNRADVVYGIALGLCNYLSVKFLIDALYSLPAFFAYASYGIGVVFLTNIVNALVLHEQLTKRDYVGMLVIALAILLLNLK